ncbi:MAG: phosphate ABC transporter ATP-binding protein, partial [Caulobacter sp.]|nr:phosphate ABC transporter ATP-binding protein [Caulobacter sp.]
MSDPAASNSSESPAMPHDTHAHPPVASVSTHAAVAAAGVKIHCQDVNAYYGDKQALYDITLDIPDRSV